MRASGFGLRACASGSDSQIWGRGRGGAGGGGGGGRGGFENADSRIRPLYLGPNPVDRAAGVGGWDTS